MRVVHLDSRTSLSGVERFVEYLCTAQVRYEGHDVSLVVSTSAKLDSFTNLLSSRRIHVYRHLDRYGRIRFSRLWAFCKTLARTDIVHVHQDWPGANMLPLCILLMLRKRHHVVFTDHIVARSRLPFWKRWLRRRFHVPYLVVSNATAQSLRGAADLDHRYATINIGSGVDVALIRRMASLQSPIPPEHRAGSFRVGFVGRIVAQKNLAALLDAVSILRHDRQLGCECHIVGEHHHHISLTDLVRERNLADCVMIHGFLENPYPLMRTFTVLCLPSLYEGTPLCVQEALALGVPCVATPTGGVCELAAKMPGYVIVCPNYSSVAIAEGLFEAHARQAELLEDKERIAALAERFFDSRLLAARVGAAYLDVWGSRQEERVEC